MTRTAHPEMNWTYVLLQMDYAGDRDYVWVEFARGLFPNSRSAQYGQ
jgi:hypothetical protein